MTEYIIAPDAVRGLEEISTYYAVHNIEAGEKLLDEFEAKCRYLVSFPNIGKSYRAIRSDLRGISFSGYIIFYRVSERKMYLLRKF